MLTLRQALEVLAGVRGGRVVVTTMSAAGVWPALSDTPLDFAYIPSSMGQGIALGLGMALAQPAHGVVSVMGDGSLLMNLGALVTVANHPAPLTVLLIDNGLYEVTGGQPTVGARRIDFAGLARAAGISRVFEFNDESAWRESAADVLKGDGPAFVWLKVEGRLGQKTPAPPHPMAEQIARLRGAIVG
jgi:sulfopyruvate decarboxylase subunit beta